MPISPPSFLSSLHYAATFSAVMSLCPFSFILSVNNKKSENLQVKCLPYFQIYEKIPYNWYGSEVFSLKLIFKNALLYIKYIKTLVKFITSTLSSMKCRSEWLFVLHRIYQVNGPNYFSKFISFHLPCPFYWFLCGLHICFSSTLNAPITLCSMYIW